MARRWGKEAVKALFNGIGSYGLSWFVAKSDAPDDYPNAPEKRSRSAIYAKARREFGVGGLTRGSYAVRELQQGTGYNREQLLRARDALRQKWKRLGPGGDHIVTEEQVEEVLAWLKHDYWSKPHRLYCCRRCATEQRSHYGLGLCQRCYFGYRRSLVRRGLPTSPRALTKMVRSLEVVKSEEHGKFLERVQSDLKRGLALDRGSLDWLGLVL